MKSKLAFLMLIISAIFLSDACNFNSEEPVNLISPSGRLLARSTKEIKKLIVKFNDEVQSTDSVRINKITYDEEDSVTVARISYSYGNKQKNTIIYMNLTDTMSNEKTLLENSKMTVIVQPNQPIVIILTDKEKHKDTLKVSTKYKQQEQ